MTQGLDTDGDGEISPAEMQDLADENLLGLAEFQYYTFGGEGRTNLIFRPQGIGHMHMENGKAVLEFTLVPIAPYPIRNMLEIEVTDPDYYVAFTFPESDGAVLVNPPLGCGVAATPPKPLSDDDAKLLANIGMDQVTLPPELRALVRDQTNIITVTCVAGASAAPESPATALDAIDTLTRPVSLPFGGPPVELGIPMPRTGFLGWVNEQQKTFYKALSGALTALKSDGNAFFILGLLSFFIRRFPFGRAGPWQGGDLELYAGRRTPVADRHRPEFRRGAGTVADRHHLHRGCRRHPQDVERGHERRGRFDRDPVLCPDRPARHLVDGAAFPRPRARPRSRSSA